MYRFHRATLAAAPLLALTLFAEPCVAAAVPFTGQLTIKIRGFSPVVVNGSGNAIVNTNGGGAFGFPITDLELVGISHFLFYSSTAVAYATAPQFGGPSVPCFGGSVSWDCAVSAGAPAFCTGTLGGACATPTPIQSLRFFGANYYLQNVSLNTPCSTGGLVPVVSCPTASTVLSGQGAVLLTVRAAMPAWTSIPANFDLRPGVALSAPDVGYRFGASPFQTTSVWNAGWRTGAVKAYGSKGSPVAVSTTVTGGQAPVVGGAIAVSLVSPIMIRFRGAWTFLDLPSWARMDLTLGTTTTTTSTTTTSVTVTTTTLPSLCDPSPAIGCRVAAAAKAQLKIKSKGGGKDQVKWKFNKGSVTEVSDFGDPTLAAPAYSFCIYDAVAGSPIFQAGIASQGSCAGKPCWKGKSKGFDYKNKVGNTEGIVRVKLKAGAAGKSQVQVQAKGANLTIPAVPLAEGNVTAQLVADNQTTVECWQVVYPTAKKNDTTQYQAKGP